MNLLNIHAHFDDFEFTSLGTFTAWKHRDGAGFRALSLICTDGAGGHHKMLRGETATVRYAEQERASEVAGIPFDVLKLENGRVPREGFLGPSPEILAALWHSIRLANPDYLFCPPLPVDPLAGVHADHLAVAESIRQVAYFINVPHAFTPEFPSNGEPPESIKTPVILTVFDGYMAGGNGYDLVVDVEDQFGLIRDSSWCHQSQIKEWLPWVGRHAMTPPATLAEWETTLRGRFSRQARSLGLPDDRAREVFTVTAWGEVPALDTVLADFPNLDRKLSRLDELERRLQRWRNC